MDFTSCFHSDSSTCSLNSVNSATPKTHSDLHYLMPTPTGYYGLVSPLSYLLLDRRGVEDTKLEARTNPLDAKDQEHRRKKKIFKIFLQAISKKGLKLRRKRSLKFFFRRSPLEENKKRSSQIFRELSDVFQQNLNCSKISAVLEPRTGQFSRT